MAECASAYEDAQVLQRQGKYIEAAQRGVICAKPTCGKVVSSECAKLYEAIQAEMPSIVLAARDTDQNDLSDVRVWIDGVLVKEKLDGSPLSVNPGVHVFRFETPRAPPVEKSFAVRAGEKLRIISETLGEKRAAIAPKVQAPAPVEAPPKPSVSPGALRAGGFVATGIGVLGFVGFGLLRWSGYNDFNQLASTCMDHCTTDDVDNAKRKFIFSYVSLGVGIAGVGTAATLFIASLGGKSDTAHVSFAPQPGGGLLSFTQRF